MPGLLFPIPLAAPHAEEARSISHLQYQLLHRLTMPLSMHRQQSPSMPMQVIPMEMSPKLNFTMATPFLEPTTHLLTLTIWSNVAAGTYTITAKATDNKNASKTSSEITIIVNDPSVPSLTATSNTTQAVDSGSAITPIVFTWGGAATDVNYTSLPGGLTASKNSSAKTLTISGTPTQNGSFSVSTVGGNSSVTLNASITSKFRFNSCRLVSLPGEPCNTRFFHFQMPLLTYPL